MDNRWTEHMTRALELARRGRGEVEPNPRVGALALAGETVVGEGWHGAWGGPHAEVEALHAAGDAAVDTVVVTLEPCCTAGKTGACTEALLARGVRRVVCGAVDPNPAHAGRGLTELRDAGVEVVEGVLAEDCLAAAGPFTRWIARRRPWVIAKWAMSMDGRIASRTGSSKWITPEGCRRAGHRLRARVDAILVGVGTVRADDPALTVRLCEGEAPPAVVIDPGAELPLDSQLLRAAGERELVVAVEEGRAPDMRIAVLERAGARVLRLPSPLDPVRVLTWLWQEREVRRVLVEGGSTLHGSLNDHCLIDQLEVHLGPVVIGGARALGPVGGEGCELMADAGRLHLARVENLDGGLRIVALPEEAGE